MAKRKTDQKAGAHLDPLVDPRLMKALEHVLRQHILLLAVQREVSPNEIAGLLGEGLGQVSYHIRVLRDECMLIKETRQEQRRGAIEHYYRATAETLMPAKAWRKLKGGLRIAMGAGMASDLFNDLAAAVKAGKLQGNAEYLMRVPMVLDEEGRRNVCAIAERAMSEVEAEQGNASARMGARNGDGGAVGYVFAVCAFEVGWNLAGPNELADGAVGREAAPGEAAAE